MALRATRSRRNAKGPMAAEQATPVIAVAGVSPVTGDAPRSVGGRREVPDNLSAA